MLKQQLFNVAALAAFTGLASSIALGSITIPTVPIGNPGNAPDPTTGFGSVAYTYNIGRTEVTNAQYAAFLNAKAASDPFGLYNEFMGKPEAGFFYGGITRAGSAGSYTYSTIAGRENHPVNYVSFWDATRFANWLHNGQGSGDTETGAYTLTPGGISANTITRNAGWQWAVTSEDEWYKAAYYQPPLPSTYNQYPTQTNTIDTSQVNYGNAIGNTTPVGSYAANYFGAFDMGGNVWEWNEAIILGSARGFRGGSFDGNDGHPRRDSRPYHGPAGEFNSVGFRVAWLPGPSAATLFAIGGLAALRRRRCVGQ
ncbi:MAG: formylglycine-generating enzyme family protein [Phycisphaerales bacterium]